MENMARLALVEQSVQDIDKFVKILYELLRHIGHILENPQDYQLRTIKSNILKDFLKLDALGEYLKYVGFESKEDKFVYPNNLTLSKLRMAQVAIERKISICCGAIDKTLIISQPNPSQTVSNTKILPANILNTTNPFLVKVQSLFNSMLRYEDPELLAYAKKQIPVVTLQLMALDRVRDQQKQIKTGEIKELDLPFDIALLMELLSWFKYKFFTWVDSPKCACGGGTIPNGGAMQRSQGEMCRVELFECTVCRASVSFPRYNNPRTLLTWRRGRCGEWANCFTLLCRALDYDVRYVYDVTDHVWCEVFDYESNKWLHCDPCEAKMDTPLMYSHGWGKQLSYVIAVSRDDLQDVTWRYTTSHKEVLKRRKECTEQQLIDSIVKLRYHRQKQGSEARRLYLAKRTILELVHLMQERKAGESELHGRTSGSVTWRRARGECGAGPDPHVFQLSERARYSISYNCAVDRYAVRWGAGAGAEAGAAGAGAGASGVGSVAMWSRGAHGHKHLIRKVEQDWKQVYLAREEGATSGEIWWKFRASRGLVCKTLSIKLTSALFEDAKITWSVAFNAERPIMADLGEKPVEFNRTFTSVTVRAALSGGSGPVAWQQAQLFRQPLDADTPAFVVNVNVE